ncbi:hypothetical protein N7522_003009 [Penicillium canescens]|nr:hypothetical protein N7522_003009 [Penicillium canescens]
MPLDYSPSNPQLSQHDPSASHLLESPEYASSEATLAAAKKALQWLCCLGSTDHSARRAFELYEFASAAASKVPHLEVPTDGTHQQRRSKLGVPYKQFSGTRDFGYDRSTGTGSLFLGLEDKEGFYVNELPSLGTLGSDIEMSDYIPDPENATLDDVLRSFAEPESQSI